MKDASTKAAQPTFFGFGCGIGEASNDQIIHFACSNQAKDREVVAARVAHRRFSQRDVQVGVGLGVSLVPHGCG